MQQNQNHSQVLQIRTTLLRKSRQMGRTWKPNRLKINEIWQGHKMTTVRTPRQLSKKLCSKLRKLKKKLAEREQSKQLRNQLRNQLERKAALIQPRRKPTRKQRRKAVWTSQRIKQRVLKQPRRKTMQKAIIKPIIPARQLIMRFTRFHHERIHQREKCTKKRAKKIKMNQ